MPPSLRASRSHPPTPSTTARSRRNGRWRRSAHRYAGSSAAPSVSVDRHPLESVAISPRKHAPPQVATDSLAIRHDSAEDFPEIIMALDMRNKTTMGCAFFNIMDGKLMISEDVLMADVAVAEQFITYIQPTILLVSGRAPDHILSLLEKQAASNDLDDLSSKFRLRVMPSSDFSHPSTHEGLVSLYNSLSNASVSANGVDRPVADAYLESREGRAPYTLQLMNCGSSINLDSIASITCAGVVLTELQRRRSITILPDGQSAEMGFHIRTIEMFSLRNHLFISQDALLSLQIIQNSPRGPDISSRGGTPKDGSSVYSLFHHLASTAQGRLHLSRLFLQPTLKLDVIAERHQTISLLLLAANEDKVRKAGPILRKIPNLRPTMMLLRKGINSPSIGRLFDRSIWATLSRFATQALRLREVASSIFEFRASETICKLVSGLSSTTINSVGDLIHQVVDFEQSKSQPFFVRAGVNPGLDKLKRHYDGMQSFLGEVVRHVRQELPEWARQCIQACIFIPQLGFLTTVNQDPNTDSARFIEEFEYENTWKRQFTDQDTIFYKNDRMTELDQHYGDIYCKIGDMEVETLHQLADDLLLYEEALVTMSDLCGEFDAIFALATGAKRYGWTAPKMTDAKVLQIKGGRHPLQELVVPSFVPNDCEIGGQCTLPDGRIQRRPTVLALTGPNHSGKSIYIKQAAIIVYLAHIGSFVPADEAIVGVTDRILTRISSRESVSLVESAFAIDLKQICQAMKYSTERTLVVVDEFGKGTNADDGAGLFTAIVDHFLSTESHRPRVLMATHFHEVFGGGYLRQNDHLSLRHMEVQTNWEAEQAEDQVIYLFTIADGHDASSFGAQCAALNGVPQEVVNRATAIALLLSQNEDIVSAYSRLSKHEKRHLLTTEKVARRFLRTTFSAPNVLGESAKNLLKDILEPSFSNGDIVP